MDGVEAARRIRVMEKGEQRTPIIAVTAHALASEKHNLLNSGMDDYVTKPINESQLVHIIHKWTGVNLHLQPDPLHEEPATKTPVNDCPVDLALGVRLANGKADLADEMLDMLYASLQKDKPQIESLLQDRDYDGLLEVVHKLHGATRYTGVPYLQKASLAVEECLKLKQYGQLELLCNALLGEIDRVLEWCGEHRTPVA
jgi:two-component system sensor histidine kinase BarA